MSVQLREDISALTTCGRRDDDVPWRERCIHGCMSSRRQIVRDLSGQGWLQGCVGMHGHELRHLCFVWPLTMILNRGGRADNVVVVL